MPFHIFLVSLVLIVHMISPKSLYASASKDVHDASDSDAYNMMWYTTSHSVGGNLDKSAHKRANWRVVTTAHSSSGGSDEDAYTADGRESLVKKQSKMHGEKETRDDVEDLISRFSKLNYLSKDLGDQQSFSQTSLSWKTLEKEQIPELKLAIKAMSSNDLFSVTWFSSNGINRFLVVGVSDEMSDSFFDKQVLTKSWVMYNDERSCEIGAKADLLDDDEVIQIYKMYLKRVGISQDDFEKIKSFHPLVAECKIDPLNSESAIRYRVTSVTGIKNFNDTSTVAPLDFTDVSASDISVARVNVGRDYIHIVYSYQDPSYELMPEDLHKIYDAENGVFKYFLVTLKNDARS